MPPRPRWVAALAALLVVAAGVCSGAPLRRVARGVPRVTGLPRVLAVYHVGYRTPALDGTWCDWVSPAQATAAARVGEAPPLATAFRPAAGPYSSTDPAAAVARVAAAAAAGVGGLLVPCRAPTMVDARGGGGHRTVAVGAAATNATALGVLAAAAARSSRVRIGFVSPAYEGRTARTVRDDVRHCLAAVAAAAAPAASLLRVGPSSAPLLVVHAARSIPCRHWRAILRRGSEFSIRGTRDDAFVVGEWRDADDGAALAACGLDGLATPPGDDVPGGADVWAADPAHWSGAAAAAAEAGLPLLATVAPGVDGTAAGGAPAAVRDREGGARYARAWRVAALSGATAVVVDSFNGWVDGTQIEAAAAVREDGCGGDGDGDEGTASAVAPGCAPAHRSYEGGDPNLYLALTAAEAKRARHTRPYELPAALASQEERMRSWRSHTGEDDDDDPTP